ncbi:MAG: leucyl aminopeptidase, partial [Janthinobacterium lividum]
MDFSIKAFEWNTAGGSTVPGTKADCIVVGVFEAQPPAGAAARIDAAHDGWLSRLIKAGDIDGRTGTTLMLHTPPQTPSTAGAARVLVVGLGKQADFGPKAYADAAKAAARALASSKATQVVFTLAQTPVEGRDAAWGVRTALAAWRDHTYRFAGLKTQAETPPAPTLKSWCFTVPAADEKAAKAALIDGAALSNGVDLTKELGNLPPNICTPTYLADVARELAADWKLKVEILGRKQIEALRMGSFLSVAKGSSEPPQFIVLRHNGGAAKAAPVVLVGKGITFDTGGISLKPGDSMDEMKYDMCGAGTVLGTMRAVAEMNLKLNVIGVIPTCENMPAGNALKPGDVVTSMSGQTIEVLNTDAEGRLVLCDALTYVERFKPAAVIDIATLTGACVIALGHHNSGLFSPDDALADELLAASKQAADAAWRMPIEEAYQEQLKTNFADMANIGGRPGGSITAACFLSRFAKAYRWAHLDIAGTAWKSGAAKGATGRPVPLLVQFLSARAAETARPAQGGARASSAAPAKAPVPALADTGAADAASSSDRATGAGRQGVRAVERPTAGP